ncbi:MAG: polysaccharide deacetylase family protein [Coriobacteriia bacterium]|nr:polysaccharide deacetylase family protein [Coriobacteriia bacterium]
MTAVSCALVVGAIWAVAVWTLVPMTVSVDGRAETVAAGSTVADLIDSGLVRSPSGDVLSLNGGVASPGKGGAPRVTVDGRPAGAGRRLSQGDTLLTSRGPDVRERTVTAFVAIPVPREESGAGPDVLVSRLGAAGLQRVTWGAVSREIEDAFLVRPATSMLVTRAPFPPGTKTVALTFDDGPWPGQTQRILEILSAENVRATFFMVGVRLRLTPDLARRVVAEGHLVGNHTLTHQMTRSSTPRQVDFQMTAGKEELRRATGVESRWFRAPSGAVTPLVTAQAAILGERVAGWTVDPADWRRPPAGVIVRRVVGAVRPGAIVLLHDGGGERNQTIAALPGIITTLKARGYRFVTLDEMLP